MKTLIVAFLLFDSLTYAQVNALTGRGEIVASYTIDYLQSYPEEFLDIGTFEIRNV